MTPSAMSLTEVGHTHAAFPPFHKCLFITEFHLTSVKNKEQSDAVPADLSLALFFHGLPKSIPSVNSSMALLLCTQLIAPPSLSDKSGGPCH